MAEERSELDRALAHPIRVELIKLLWHLGDSATPDQLRDDLRGDETLQVVAYHARVLERAA
jgi:DNA-binding transcriptional ArsR family regulator